MQQKNKFNILFLWMAILFASCEKNATISVPESKPKLVIGCFISPQDTVVKVTVTSSTPLFGYPYNAPEITDAKVTISNGLTSVVLPYNASLTSYQLPVVNVFPFVGGATYSLTVSENGFDDVEASCTIPINKPDTMDVIIDKTNIYDLRAHLKWQDFVGEKNFYRGVVISVLYDSSQSKYVSYAPWTFSTTDVISDLNSDGNMLSLNFENNYLYHPADWFDVYLFNTDENYYNYQQSINNFSNDDPFAEPTPIYTNVKNGLGIFCGYQQLYRRYY